MKSTIKRQDYLTQRALILMFILVSLVLSQSCKNKTTSLTDSYKKAIIDSAKITVEKVFESSNSLKFLDGLKYYSDDEDTYYTNNGTILTLADLKKSYSQIGTSVEILNNSIKSWNSTILSENTVAFTLPINLKIRLKGTPEYNGQLVWSGIVQKRNNKWMIIQSHESWLNCVEVYSTLTPTD